MPFRRQHPSHDLARKVSASSEDGKRHMEQVIHQLQQRLSHISKSSVAQRPALLPTLGVIGLAAVAGAAVYATRTPRIPKGVEPIGDFNPDRYMGKWYEIARLEHRWERGLQRTQAEYSRNHDGSIHVINRGFDAKRNFWKVTHGTAKPTIAPDVGALKVSFFKPFYGGYNIVELCKDYQWALVIGSSHDYCWILSRKPSLPDGVREHLTEKARSLGIDPAQLLWVHQDGVNPTGSYQK